MKQRIKVIKQCANKTASDQTQTATRRQVTAAQTVKNWIAEFNAGKERSRNESLRMLYGAN